MYTGVCKFSSIPEMSDVLHDLRALMGSFDLRCFISLLCLHLYVRS